MVGKPSGKKSSPIWLILVGVLFSCLFLVLQDASGQASRWSTPEKLSSDRQGSAFPEILTDLTGRVHIFWSSEIGDYDVVMYKSFLEGKGWSENNDIAALHVTSGRIITRPAAIIDSKGIMHLAYRNFNLFYSDAPVALMDTANAWSKVKQIVTGGNVVYFVRMAVDRKGQLHLLYSENKPGPSCSVCFHLYYINSKDNGQTWSEPLLISEPGNGTAKPQILIDPQDVIHVVWEAGPGGDLGAVEINSTVVYASSRDGGKTWSSPLPFKYVSPVLTAVPTKQNAPSPTPTPDTVENPNSEKFITIGRDGSGNLIVVWLSIPDDILYFSTSQDEGKTWTSAQPIPGVVGGWTIYPARTDDYAMATDSAGGVHLVLSGRTRKDQKNLSLLHLTWDGKSWSLPEAIKNLVGYVPEWPRIAIGNGNELHVVWFERDKAHIFASDTGLYTIWYSRGSIDAPVVAPKVYPTLAPSAVPTADSPVVLPSPTPTIQPAAAAVVISKQSNGLLGIKQPAYNETDYLAMIAKILIPSVLFVSLVILVAVIRRRR